MDHWRHWGWHLVPHPHTSTRVVVHVVQGSGGGPNWAEIVTAIGTAIIAIGVIVALVQVQEARHSRHAAIAVETAKTWSEPELIEARLVLAKIPQEALCEFVMTLLDRKHPHYFVVIREPLFFEWLGALEQSRWIETSWIDKTLGTSILDCWEKWEDTVAEFQRRQESDQPFCNFKLLAAKIARKRDPKLRWLPLKLRNGWRRFRAWLSRVAWKVAHQSHPFSP